MTIKELQKQQLIAHIHVAIAALTNVIDAGGTGNDKEYKVLIHANEILRNATHKAGDGEVEADPAATNPDAGQASENAEEPRLTQEMFKSAYALLKNESKPGPALLVKQLGINREQAVVLVDKLKSMGKLSGKQPSSGSTPDSKDDVKKPTGNAGTPANFLELVSKIPAGDDLLVANHLHPLIHLDPKSRALYLAGHNAGEFVSADTLAAAVSTGADTTLVKELIRLADKKVPIPPQETMIRDVKKYEKFVIAFCTKVPNGKDLYNYMSATGLYKHTLNHMKTIFQAYA